MMFGKKLEAAIKQQKERFPEGCRVRLVRMDDEQAPVAGTEGTVTHVDGIASVHVRWDSGSSLAALYEVDEIERI